MRSVFFLLLLTLTLTCQGQSAPNPWKVWRTLNHQADSCVAIHDTLCAWYYYDKASFDPGFTYTVKDTGLQYFSYYKPDYEYAIKKADGCFSDKDFEKAKMLYRFALKFKQNEQYPKDKIAECVKLIPVQKIINDSTTVYGAKTTTLKKYMIPSQVFKFSNLKNLSIMGMDCDHLTESKCYVIREIPGQIASLKKLEVLILNLNAIYSIPPEMAELKKLRVLDLTDNTPLKKIDNVTKIENLEELYLFGCGLSKMPENIGALYKLKVLGLTGNNLAAQEIERINKLLPGCRIIYE